MDVETTNKKPEYVAKLYLDAVSPVGSTPIKLKADDGTEHSIIEPIQLYLTTFHRDDLESFNIIPSTRNQRRRLFQDLADLGVLEKNTKNPVFLDCVRYCFMDFIRADLDDIKDEHNAHIIPGSRNGGSGSGDRPDSMYDLPHLYGADHDNRL